MTAPQPIDADFIFADIVIDETRHEQAKLVVIEFETAAGPVVLQLRADGALELQSSLQRLPLERHTHSG